MAQLQKQLNGDVPAHPDPQATASPLVVPRRAWRRGLIASALAVVVLAATLAFVATLEPQAGPATSLPVTGATINGTDGQLAATLTYLVEEEKLAHDIYVLGDSLYGARVFSNISRSETQHQESIRELLTTYGLPDPSANQAPGDFSDPALQALYDSLAERMAASAAEAMQVGILIEQTDIADLQKALAVDSPPEVANVLARLEAASQNHLQAFLRQASRV